MTEPKIVRSSRSDDYSARYAATLKAENAALREKLAEAEAARDSAIQQAQAWKMEAQCHKSSLHEAYQAVTGGTGEPGNWNGAKPIINALTGGDNAEG